MTIPVKPYDIAVIGAGPAGSTAAYLLACRGYRVLLVDRLHFPRPKLCAGLLTWKTIELLRSLYGCSVEEMISLGIISHSTRNYRIFHGTTLIARGRLDYPFHFANRTRYDHFWLQKAITAGAHALTGQAVRGIDPSKRTMALSDGRRICAQVIIGADGVRSITRRSLVESPEAAKRWRRQLAMAIETRCTASPGMAAENDAILHFGLVPWGYAWSFPDGRNRIVGICGLQQKSDRPLLEAFKEFRSSLGTGDTVTTAVRGHALPLGNFLDPPGFGRILLVGDACGLADPLLGEGIYYAHRSAQIAASAIIACAPTYANLDQNYRADLKKDILRELHWIKAFRNLLYMGGRRRRFRGLRLLLRLMPNRLEAAIQGQRPFSRLLWPPWFDHNA
jgi:geranylgeranyl reductase family protein